jgi:hypothetical protein
VERERERERGRHRCRRRLRWRRHCWLSCRNSGSLSKTGSHGRQQQQQQQQQQSKEKKRQTEEEAVTAAEEEEEEEAEEAKGGRVGMFTYNISDRMDLAPTTSRPSLPIRPLKPALTSSYLHLRPPHVAASKSVLVSSSS